MDQDLLDDLEELGAEDDYYGDEAPDTQHDEDSQDPSLPLLGPKKEPLSALTKTYRSKQMAEVLEKIAAFMDSERSIYHNSGPIESDPEYSTIVQANTLNVELIHEITMVNKKIKDLFEPRFAELEKLVLNPFEYAKAVKMIGNETDLTKIDLKSFLPSATVMVIIVTSTTTDGRLLRQEELDEMGEACDVIFEMDACKTKLLNYVQSRMSNIAPNLSVLLGSSTAAKIMGLAGGLTALSKIPGCNILVLGAQKSGSLGLSRIATGDHAGYIYECDIVLNAPSHIRRKAARLLSAKAALACRCDLSREYPDGRMGKEFREDVEKKVGLLIEPPPAKKIKALPLPIEHKKRRGGKKARKAKERMAQSELSKAANRIEFGKEEIEVGEHLGSTIGLGMLGGSTGKLKLAHKDFKIPLSKRQKQMTTFQNNNNPNSGLMSTVAFTPIKGIEMVDPALASQKLKSVNDKYFAAPVFKKPANSDAKSQ
ncbi:U4/U6 small nuclear ribonucleoprotein Prp31 [Kappamyces sp. JEL0829]|nr:U4/U6 small nuclear ribonucleoprotein Prp31 [Kappamyces sp. JEL0829]